VKTSFAPFVVICDRNCIENSVRTSFSHLQLLTAHASNEESINHHGFMIQFVAKRSHNDTIAFLSDTNFSVNIVSVLTTGCDEDINRIMKLINTFLLVSTVAEAFVIPGSVSYFSGSSSSSTILQSQPTRQIESALATAFISWTIMSSQSLAIPSVTPEVPIIRGT
jgi:hypothetical protein